MRSFTDQLGHVVTLSFPPRVIVSLVPSQTELLHHLRLDEEVAGITKFCIHPQSWFRTKKRIGGTKGVHLDAIRELQPDLILANKEENVREEVEALRAEYPVWTSDIQNLEETLRMIRSVGELTDRKSEGEALARQIEQSFSTLVPIRPPLRTAYLIWRQPYMTVGHDTFIHEMLRLAGFENVFGELSRYPAVTSEELAARNPQVLFLSSEPYPFREKHIDELQAVLPRTRILLVDGELFSWYGSRLLQAPPYFDGLYRQIVTNA